MTRPLRRSRRLLVAVLLAVVAVGSAGCQARVDVIVDLERDGSGEVRVGVGLDDDALGLLGDADRAFEVDDLRARGWTVAEPASEQDGLTWVRASRPVESTAEAEAALAEVSGDDGPFGAWSIERRRGLVRDELEVVGTVDLRGELEGFSDDALRERLGGELAERLRPLRDRVDAALDEAFRFRIAVQLPGTITSNAPVELDGAAVWTPGLGDRLELEATSSVVRTTTVVWWTVGAAALVALLGVLGRRGWRRRRARRAIAGGDSGAGSPPE